MSHLVLVDANDVSLNVMGHALNSGYHVSLVHPRSFRWYTKSAYSIDLLRSATRVIPIHSAGNESEVVSALLALQADQSIDGVLNTVDATIETTASACESVGLRFTAATAVKNSRNKFITRQVLASAGLFSPRCALATDFESALSGIDKCGFPAIMKPVSGFASFLTYRVNNYAEADRAARQLLRAQEMVPDVAQEVFSRGILIEEYLPGTLVSAEVAAFDERFVGLMITGRGVTEHNECCGMGSVLPAGLSHQDEKMCFDYAEAVCGALNLTFGVFNLEIMLTANGPVLIEANPRMMGGIMPTAYKFATGQTFEDIVLRVYTGHTIQEPVSSAQYAVIRKLISTFDTILPSNVDLDPIVKNRDCAYFANHLITSSREVSSGDILARFIICDQNLEIALDRANSLLSHCEAVLRTPLMRPTAEPRPFVFSS